MQGWDRSLTGLFILPQGDHRMFLLQRAKQFLARVVDNGMSFFRKPILDLPRSLRDELEKQAAKVTERPVTLGNMTSESTATAGLADVPPGRGPVARVTIVALSTDANGLVRWHLPLPGGSLPVPINPRAKVQKYTFPHLGDIALDLLRVFERSLGKPMMKRLPDQSRHPKQQQAPELKTLRELLDLEEVLRKGGPPWEGNEKKIPDGDRVLVLVHGIFDSVFGPAFSPLLLWGDLLERLQRHYRQRIYGFDHETLSVDPVQNARELMSWLPSNTEIDIVCHSRGGLVTRALLQHPEFQKRLKTDIRIRKVIFMGAANEGSPLAEPAHRGQLLEVFTELIQQRAPKSIQAARFKLLVEAAKVIANPAANLPGLAALRPGSPLIQALSQSPVPAEVTYSFVCASFKNARDKRLRHLEPISAAALGADANDLVVPYSGMTSLGAPIQGTPVTLGDEHTPQGDFYHLNYLDSPAVRDHITAFLGVP
jgi:hypothetical protein